jgi:hypothetical protein
VGLDRSESVTVSVALYDPGEGGAKVTLTEQDEDAARELPHVLALMVKSAALAPEICSGLIVTVAVPAFVTVTVFD